MKELFLETLVEALHAMLSVRFEYTDSRILGSLGILAIIVFGFTAIFKGIDVAILAIVLWIITSLLLTYVIVALTMFVVKLLSR